MAQLCFRGNLQGGLAAENRGEALCAVSLDWPYFSTEVNIHYLLTRCTLEFVVPTDCFKGVAVLSLMPIFSMQ